MAGDPNAPIKHELSGVIAHLTPAEVLQAQEVALMLTQVKARIANGLAPVGPADQGRP